MIVQCVECHLPPGGTDYLKAKVFTGLRDVYGTVFKDVSKINWDLKSSRNYAINHVFKASCISCHQNLFPRTLSTKGEDAHLYYNQNPEQLRCINCHLEVGHFHKKPVEIVGLEKNRKINKTIYLEPTAVDSFVNFTERIPNTTTDFEMVAIPGGTFTIGSPDSEPYRDEDEGPQRTIQVSSFWMGKHEVSWEEYDAFYQDTKGEGRTEDQYRYVKEAKNVDAVTGPTPAYGNPDQGWGKGRRPAITMTHYAARKYCEWLSKKTGKKYRLPTEAEWEYACRGNTDGAYFFDGDPAQFSQDRFWNKIFGIDTAIINSHIVYIANSEGKTRLPSAVKTNPFGLVNTLGNVKEFCSDWYAEDTYSSFAEGRTTIDPKGPAAGKEYVIRGGSFFSDAGNVRIADRDFTKHDKWLLTDPQIPKSLWWYSDCNDVGFRVICEYKLIKLTTK
jgi:formylglycine-generating enzyme required for sulfatase activity